jgi:serine/threonine protein kinase
MAPEILNYIPEVDPETSEYTNAVDMWALGCIVYRLVCGVVPFPPGPSLVKFCVNESEFPPKVEELTGLAQTFVKGLIVPYPSRRLTAQQALEHPWTRSGKRSFPFYEYTIVN